MAVYKKIDKCTIEELRKLDGMKDVFFRFHDPNRRISSRSKSWGMIFESAQEALSCDSTVLDGKSCTGKAEELMSWKQEFDEDYVIIAFVGCNTRETGHDGETVATYYKKLKCFSYSDFVNCFVYKKFKYSGWSGDREVCQGYVYKDDTQDGRIVA
mgnify:CR=1 FL=1